MTVFVWNYGVDYKLDTTITPLKVRKVTTVLPKKRCVKPMVKPLVAVEGFLDTEEELLAIVNSIAQRQMRQMWGKDMNHID